MNVSTTKVTLLSLFSISSILTLFDVSIATESKPPQTSASPSVNSPGPQTFASAEDAANTLVDAAENFDVPSLIKIVSPQGEGLILTGEFAQDRERAQEFAAQARIKKHIAIDPKSEHRAYLLVGEQDWPFPLPIAKDAGRWSFDITAGRQELIWRRIGSNELDAITICRGFVEAQHEYALRNREGYQVAQYAQRVISSQDKQDGLAWQNKDGTWGGPIGEKIAQAIEQGYDLKGEPYHGYFFKVLKGQGPAAPLGTLDFVVNGVMIGGFALVAAPAEYGESGLKTFMVSHTGIVYEKDFGPATLDAFQKMERFNPDKSWTAVAE